MRILIINPNTSDDFTAAAQRAADLCKSPGTEVKAVSSPIGPVTIEGYFDEMITTLGVLDVVQREKDNYDAFISACFSNHVSTYAARQLTDKPVLGIFEPPILLATQLGSSYSVVSTSDRWKPLLEEGIEAVGLGAKCASVRVTGLAVEALEKMPQEELEDYIKKSARVAMEEDGAEVIVLGCCGMAGLDARLTEALGVPVIDPVAAAVKMAETLVSMKLKTSQAMTYSPVLPRRYVNVPDVFHSLYDGTDSTQK